MGKRRRTLLLAALCIMLSVAMLVAGTYALFSDSVEVENHLIAGTLDVELWRTKLVKRKLDSTDGVVKPVTESEEKVNFTNATSKNVFGIDNAEYELIAPSSSYTATMLIKNKGDVAFDCYVKIKLSTDSASNILSSESNDVALRNQVRVVVTYGGTEVYSEYLSDYGTEGKSISVGTVLKGKEEEFSVQLIFENRDDNNSAQSGKAWFDLIVEATQHVE